MISGVISRLEAENYLLNMTLGSYLVRVSERVWGYTISYRAEDRCKHFLVDTSEQGYQFFGANQLVHRSLADLINFHKVKFDTTLLHVISKLILLFKITSTCQDTVESSILVMVEFPWSLVVTFYILNKYEI